MEGFEWLRLSLRLSYHVRPMSSLFILAQTPTPASGPSASTIFYLTLLFIFLTAIITTLVTRYSRDKCLKFFHQYHVTLTRSRGQTVWGGAKVFASGLEVVYDHPFTDLRGHRKTSQLYYQSDLDNNILCLCRFHDELDPSQAKAREQQIRRTFNPGPLRRTIRRIRNLINALRDGFNAAFGAVVAQASRANPTSAVLSTQANSVTQIGQTLLSKFGNAFEPLLEQYIGREVILDVADPINPNNATIQFSGFLADYTQQWVALFNVSHNTCEHVTITLPDVEQGDTLPPLPPPPPPNAPAPVLPPPAKTEQGFEIRVDGKRFKILNTRHQTMVVRKLERPGLEPVEFGAAVPPRSTFDLPIRDARGGILHIDLADTLDVVAPRKYAIIRHAGSFTPPQSLLDELAIDQLPRKFKNALNEDVTKLIR